MDDLTLEELRKKALAEVDAFMDEYAGDSSNFIHILARIHLKNRINKADKDEVKQIYEDVLSRNQLIVLKKLSS